MSDACIQCGVGIYYCEVCRLWHHEPWVEEDAAVLELAKCVGEGGPFQTEETWIELYGKAAVDGR